MPLVSLVSLSVVLVSFSELFFGDFGVCGVPSVLIVPLFSNVHSTSDISAFPSNPDVPDISGMHCVSDVYGIPIVPDIVGYQA